MTIGKLFVVATPIGNFGDLSYRAVQILNDVDCILAEDTRRTGLLLNHYQIKTPMRSFHAFNEASQEDDILRRLENHQQLALVSDAGTPLISDPGQRLIRQLQLKHYPVIAIPGPCAAIAALSVAGLPTHEFRFMGFLPETLGAKQKLLSEISEYPKTMIFYEAPHRLRQTLQVLIETMGKTREVTLAKELTKTYERVYLASLQDALIWLDEDPKRCQGEFVIVLNGCEQPSLRTDSDNLLTILLAELPLKQAVKIAQSYTGLARNEIYQKALELQNQLSQGE